MYTTLLHKPVPDQYLQFNLNNIKYKVNSLKTYYFIIKYYACYSSLESHHNIMTRSNPSRFSEEQQQVRACSRDSRLTLIKERIIVFRNSSQHMITAL